jgi:hypothetical protein
MCCINSRALMVQVAGVVVQRSVYTQEVFIWFSKTLGSHVVKLCQYKAYCMAVHAFIFTYVCSTMICARVHVFMHFSVAPLNSCSKFFWKKIIFFVMLHSDPGSILAPEAVIFWCAGRNGPSEVMTNRVSKAKHRESGVPGLKEVFVVTKRDIS